MNKRKKNSLFIFGLLFFQAAAFCQDVKMASTTKYIKANCCNALQLVPKNSKVDNKTIQYIFSKLLKKNSKKIKYSIAQRNIFLHFIKENEVIDSGLFTIQQIELQKSNAAESLLNLIPENDFKLFNVELYKYPCSAFLMKADKTKLLLVKFNILFNNSAKEKQDLINRGLEFITHQN